MVKTINSLTSEQSARMPAHRDKWINIGLSTAPMDHGDRAAVEASIKFWYRRANLAEPKVIVFVPSPFALRVAGGIAGGAIYAARNGWPKGSSAVDSAVDSAVRSAVDSAVRGAVGSAVDSAVGSAVGVDDPTRFLLLCANSAGWSEWGGNMWPGYTAWRTFFTEVCDLEIAEMDALAAWEVVSSRCGPYALYPDFAMVSDRPSTLKRDAGGRLHCENGPAIAFRDTWSLHFWHGMQIPRSHEWIIDDRARLSPSAIEAEKNAELRRMMLEVFGFENYLAAREAKVVSADELHGRPRRLLEINVAGDRLRVIEVINGSLEPDGSRRKFHLGAMRGETPAEVVAASYGIAPKHYVEAVRT